MELARGVVRRNKQRRGYIVLYDKMAQLTSDARLFVVVVVVFKCLKNALELLHG